VHAEQDTRSPSSAVGAGDRPATRSSGRRYLPPVSVELEKALKRYAGVKSMMVNLMHGIVLVEADISKISREELAARSGIAPEVS
jgi:hypothetical protein